MKYVIVKLIKVKDSELVKIKLFKFTRENGGKGEATHEFVCYQLCLKVCNTKHDKK